MGQLGFFDTDKLLGRRSDLQAAFEGLVSVEAVVAPRLRHYLTSLPIAYHPADVFARDPGQGRQVALVDLVADHDPPCLIGFAEKLPKLYQGPCQALLDR